MISCWVCFHKIPRARVCFCFSVSSWRHSRAIKAVSEKTALCVALKHHCNVPIQVVSRSFKFLIFFGGGAKVFPWHVSEKGSQGIQLVHFESGMWLTYVAELPGYNLTGIFLTFNLDTQMFKNWFWLQKKESSVCESCAANTKTRHTSAQLNCKLLRKFFSVTLLCWY